MSAPTRVSRKVVCSDSCDEKLSAPTRVSRRVVCFDSCVTQSCLLQLVCHERLSLPTRVSRKVVCSDSCVTKSCLLQLACHEKLSAPTRVSRNIGIGRKSRSMCYLNEGLATRKVKRLSRLACHENVLSDCQNRLHLSVTTMWVSISDVSLYPESKYLHPTV